MSSFNYRQGQGGLDPAAQRGPHPPQSPNRFLRWLPFALILGTVGAAIAAADLQRARALFIWIDAHRGSDKVAHFLLLGGLALALNYGLRARLTRIGPVALLTGGMIVAVLITVEEISQRWIPSRHFDLGDLAANYAGIAFADWLARRWLR